MKESGVIRIKEHPKLMREAALWFHEKWGEVPVSAPGWVCEEIVRHHLECPSLLCILSFQDWLSIDEEIRYPDVNTERINVPANPRHYWRYRMHLTLEELIKNKKFNEKLVEMIDTTGRF